ncbi:MAG: VCBS repeat-containing protein, partial [Rhodothermales bacterium]|nr:VCBS repeat-containing protein [Rhodothermales bacterium]
MGFASASAGQIASFTENPLALSVVSTAGTDYAIPFFGGFNNPVPQLVDIDGDGDLDLFIQETSNDLQYYENTGSAQSPAFVLRSRRWNDLSIGAWFRFVDVDSDGDYDVLGNQTFNAIRYYENIGSPQTTDFILRADTLRSSDGTVVTTELPNIPAIVDIDCDENLDLLLGLNDGTITHFEQSGFDSGLPVFNFVEQNYQDILVVGESGKSDRHGANALIVDDLDADGISDLLWGDFFELSLITFINASDTCADVELVRTADTLTTLNEGPFLTRGFNVPAVGDLDGDGFNDIVAGVLSNSTVDDENTLYRFSSDAGNGWLLDTRRLIDGIDVGTASVPAIA